jgi:CBS domain-containing protein
MTTLARDVMTSGPEVAREDDSVLDVAKKLAADDYGAMPVCGTDERLKGVITDRDIVVNVLARDRDPASTKVGEIVAGDGETVTIGADDSVDEAARTMAEHGVRRLPVIDGDRLVGMVTQADLATDGGDDAETGDTVEQISEQAPNN